MKKRSKKQSQSFETLSNSRAAHNEERKHHTYNPDKPRFKAPKVLGARELQAPKILQLTTHEYHNDTVNLIRDLWDLTIEDNVRLRFDNCTQITVPALLLLYANLHIIRDEPSRKMVRIPAGAASHHVKTLLTTCGVLDMLKNAEAPDPFGKHQAPIIHGLYPRHDEILDHIQNTVYKGKLSPAEENRLGDALSEVFLNVADHAYPAKQYPGLEGTPWWTIWSVIDGQLWLAIFDSGVGIPSTITEDHWLTRTLKGYTPEQLKIFTNDDAAKIELAMIEGQNRRKNPKHGQGSASIHALVEANPRGELWVYSNQGRYHWYRDASTNNQPTHKKASHRNSINGTIVQWNIEINHE